ncbi:MAG: endonuclease/exonuclease/phosphatase family protein, partial [gamma proteobacterium symbiont of Lucinoma myriamae]|nr:endonuclease/exonuclease/phosphatase family protein [gamma proteobacterium symbiont of Lucinoma myriamae]
QGANNIGKRIDLFQHLKEQKSDIYCLVDTHFTQQDQNLIRSQWEFDCSFNSYSSNSRGIAILFNNTTEHKIHKQLKDAQGNYLIVDVSVQSKRLTLAAVYGPNLDSPQFFKSFFEEIDKIENESVIICGDFNLVLDPKLDYYNYKHINNRKARQLVLDEIEIRNLKDPFRLLSPLQRRYTWRRKNPLQQARLDFFLVSDDIQQNVIRCNIGISYRSDHSMVTLEINFFDIKKGKSLWKHNNSLLSDMEYINTINNKIKDIKQQYALPVYNYDNINDVPDDEIQFVIDDQLFLDTLLMELRGKSISFSSFRRKQTDKNEQEIIRKIKSIEENLTESKQDELDSDLEKLIHEKMKGMFLGQQLNG